MHGDCSACLLKPGFQFPWRNATDLGQKLKALVPVSGGVLPPATQALH